MLTKHPLAFAYDHAHTHTPQRLPSLSTPWRANTLEKKHMLISAECAVRSVPWCGGSQSFIRSDRCERIWKRIEADVSVLLNDYANSSSYGTKQDKPLWYQTCRCMSQIWIVWCILCTKKLKNDQLKSKSKVHMLVFIALLREQSYFQHQILVRYQECSASKQDIHKLKWVCKMILTLGWKLWPQSLQAFSNDVFAVVAVTMFICTVCFQWVCVGSFS